MRLGTDSVSGGWTIFGAVWNRKSYRVTPLAGMYFDMFESGGMGERGLELLTTIQPKQTNTGTEIAGLHA